MNTCIQQQLPSCPDIFTSMFPKSTHETLSQKLYEKFKNHKRFTKPKLSRTAFTIQHYAGDVSISHYNTIPVVQCLYFCLSTIILVLFQQVTYQSDQFLDKNKDYVVAEHQELLNASKCSFVSVLFPPATEENTKSSKSSIASRFKVTFLQYLIYALYSVVIFILLTISFFGLSMPKI